MAIKDTKTLSMDHDRYFSMDTRWSDYAPLNTLWYHLYQVWQNWKGDEKCVLLIQYLGLLRSLQDSGAPELDVSNNDLRQTEAKELENGNKASLLRYMGLPLRVFEKVRTGYCFEGKLILLMNPLLGLLLSTLPTFTTNRHVKIKHHQVIRRRHH
jgi:hypothetical protein